MKKKKLITLILVGVFVLALAVAIYFIWFFSHSCDDLVYYKDYQGKCSRASFVDDADDITLLYEVKGKHNGKCEIKVTALQVKEGSSDKIVLEGKSMVCDLFIGSKFLPGEDISLCKGELKEELQNLIIQNLQKYIIENLGEIGEELKGI